MRAVARPTYQGGILTPLIKVIRHGQVTLPAEFREALALKEGDYLEAEIQEAAIVLRPAVVMSRDEAIHGLHDLMDRVQARNQAIPDAEVDRDVAQAIQAVRSVKKPHARRS
jgi:AbrB family looped-hinge helix DNA binding protein